MSILLSMKLTRTTFVGLSSAALIAIAVFVAVHYVERAKDNTPAIRVENTPSTAMRGLAPATRPS